MWEAGVVGVPSAFIGREAECRALAELVGGCELAPIEPSAGVGVAVASQLGFAGPEALAVGLGDARTLLVLDNCEHVLAGAAELAALLLEHAPELHVLATSRSPLGVAGEEPPGPRPPAPPQ